MVSSGSSKQFTSEVADAVNSFGINMLNVIREANATSNTVFSPISISTAFSFIYLGARGETRKQMSKAFNFDKEGVVNTLTSNSKGRNGQFLTIANQIFVHSELNLTREFEASAQDVLATVDFGKPEETRGIINAWVDDATNGLISELFAEGALSQEALMAVANAVYFKGLWETTFETTEDGEFEEFDGSKSTGKFMIHKGKQFKVKSWMGTEILELPYINGRFSMNIVLPMDGRGLDEVVATLTTEQNTPLLFDNMKLELFDSIRIPKIEIETSIDADSALRSLGVNQLFDSQNANLEGISEEPLYVNSAIHKAKIIVNEKGTEAGAGSGVVLTPLTAVVTARTFNADHPFLYFILDKLDGVIIFMGSVESIAKT